MESNYTAAMANQESTGAQSPESTANSTPLFRPIEFEANTGSEGSEYGGSDSAYSSDNLQGPEVYQNSKHSFTRKISATLQNRSMWQTFTRIGNEMIVTKPGRRLFPSLMVSLNGLNLDKDYAISLQISPADNQRYRYINMKWCATGESEVIQNEDKQIFHHPSSPNSGQFWMKRPISFKTIKITHYAKSKHGNILLHTMHKYSIQIVIHSADGSQSTVLSIPDTTFIAVSAYQNVELTQLKIDSNPFAKGFRYKSKSSMVPNASSNGASATSVSGLQVSGTNNFAAERSMLAYLQHIQQLHSLAATQPFAPAVLTTSSISSESSMANATPSSSTNSPNHPPVPALVSNGMSPHFPVFYSNPFMPPYQISAVNNSATDKEH